MKRITSAILALAMLFAVAAPYVYAEDAASIKKSQTQSELQAAVEDENVSLQEAAVSPDGQVLSSDKTDLPEEFSSSEAVTQEEHASSETVPSEEAVSVLDSELPGASTMPLDTSSENETNEPSAISEYGEFTLSGDMDFNTNVAVTTPSTVTIAQAQARIQQLRNMFVGRYFTVNGQKCPNESGHGCSNCEVTNVVSSSWVRNLVGMGTMYPGATFPKQYFPGGGLGGNTGYSCYGFANFAHWYIFAQRNTDDVTRTYVTTCDYTYSAINQYACPGDVIRTQYSGYSADSGHSFIFVSCDSDGIWALDCNGLRGDSVGCCLVRYRKIPYGEGGAYRVAITSTANYDKSSRDTTVPTISEAEIINKTTTSYTVKCRVTDNAGIDRVQFPVWTELNGQDDIFANWGDSARASGTRISGNNKDGYYTYTVNISDHNSEKGIYHCHIYAYDTSGNVVCISAPDCDMSSLLPTGVTLNKTSAALSIGSIEKLTATILPSSATNKTVTWTTSNSTVATVSNGTVTAKAAGTAIITVRTSNGKTATCTVTVKAAETGVEAFVERLYTVALGRASDPMGKADWVNSLKTGRATGAEVAAGFILSNEFRDKNLSDNNFTDTMYKTFFNRGADSSGKAYWIDVLSKGVSREYVLRGFAESSEFSTLCGSFGITRGNITLTQPRDQNVQLTSFVNRLYTELLKRGGEEDGLNDWCGRILRKQATPKSAAHGFVFSNEFMTSVTDNVVFIDRMYRTFLGRDADAQGKADWLNRLAQGQSREEIFNGFADSVEFGKIVSSFGL